MVVANFEFQRIPRMKWNRQRALEEERKKERKKRSKSRWSMIVYPMADFFFFFGKGEFHDGPTTRKYQRWWKFHVCTRGASHPPAVFTRIPLRFSLSSRSDGHKKPLTDIIHSKLVYNVPTCSVSSSRRRGGRSGPKRKSATGHVATWRE